MPAALGVLLLPVLRGSGSVCNVLGMVERGIVAAVFLAGAVLLAMGRSRRGSLALAAGVTLNVLLVLMWWLLAGHVTVTVEIVGWAVLDALIVVLLVLSGWWRANDEATH
jgi:hypothetical protein